MKSPKGIIVLFVVACFILPPVISSDTTVGKLIIDTDAGADDAMAILLALASEARDDNDLEILAITCTYGNTALKNVVENVLKTVTVGNRSDIPIYVGATKPLIKEYETSPFFGNNGLGDFIFDQEITAEVNTSMHAASLIVSLVQQYPGEITILALGPVTNLALAMSLDPTLIDNLQQLYIMGASVSNHGNMQSNEEFNFELDPESNFIVLNGTTSPSIVLCPWEANIESPMTRDWRTNVLGALNSTAVKFLNKAESVSIEFYDHYWYAPDPLCAASLLWPDIVTEIVRTNTYAVIDGFARGSVIVDYTYASGRPNNTDIILSIDREAFKDLLLIYLDEESTS